MENNQLFTSVDHISIRCSDLDKSIGFYTKVLGFTPAGRTVLPDPKSDLVYVAKGGVRLELSQRDLTLCTSEGITNHIALSVPDIHTAHDVLKECEECEVIGAPVQDIFCFFFISGPSGEKIEIIQHL